MINSRGSNGFSKMEIVQQDELLHEIAEVIVEDDDADYDDNDEYYIEEYDYDDDMDDYDYSYSSDSDWTSTDEAEVMLFLQVSKKKNIFLDFSHLCPSYIGETK